MQNQDKKKGFQFENPISKKIQQMPEGNLQFLKAL